MIVQDSELFFVDKYFILAKVDFANKRWQELDGGLERLQIQPYPSPRSLI
jgi:hypothetical protein